MTEENNGKRPKGTHSKFLKKLFSRLWKIPAAAYSRFGIWQILPFLLLSAGAVFLIPKLNISADISATLPENDPYFQLEGEMLEGFPASDFLIVFFESDSLFSPDTLERVDRLTVALEDLKAVDYVLSPTNFRDVKTMEGELQFPRIYGPMANDYSGMKSTIEETPLFSNYFLSKGGSSWNIYLFLPEGFDYKRHVPEILEVVRNAGDERCGVVGDEVSRYYLGVTALKDLYLLGSIALLIVICIEIFICRSVRAGLFLSVTAAIPVLWVIALFPVLGYSITVYNAILPIFILVLATSYGIHLYRYYSYEIESKSPLGGMGRALDYISPVVVSAGLTTMVGFVALLITPLVILRELGFLIILGIFFALITALFFFPPLLRNIGQKAEPLTSRIHFDPSKILFFRGKRVIILFLLCMIVLSLGFMFLQSDYRRSTFFMPRTEIYSMLKSYHEKNGASEELTVVIDLGQEYGFMDPEVFTGIKGAAAHIRSLPFVSRVLTPVEIIEWFNGRLLGVRQPATPETEYAIGEAAELLAYEETGIGIQSLLDGDYSKVKMIIQFSALGKSAEEASRSLHELKLKIDEALSRELHHARYGVFGAPVIHDRAITYLFRSQFTALAFFFVFLLGFLMLILKSLRFSLVTLIPTLSALIFYFGVLGWFRVPITTEVVFIIAGVMGVSNDDVLYFVLVFRRHLRDHDAETALSLTFQKTGMAIIQTTAIILGGFTVLLFSRLRTVVTVGFLGALSLVVATAVTCLVIPVILRYICRKKEKA